MKIGLLGPANSIHLVKIANALYELGVDIVVISLPNHKAECNMITVPPIYLKVDGYKGYYMNAIQLKKIISNEKIDLLSVHYASGYGTLARLARAHPMILSVWGSDIYSFPKQNFYYKKIIENNLKKSDGILSTSKCMAEEIKKYCERHERIHVTPFGVDLNEFKPLRSSNNGNKRNITIGFMKGSDYIYGIDLFLIVIKELKKIMNNNGYGLNVIVCGSGTRVSEIISKIEQMKIDDIVDYRGMVPHIEMPNIINMCDIICIPSIMESFGVIALEAMACGVPCVTSCAPGLKEVVKDGVTGFVTDGKIEQYIDRITQLAFDDDLRYKMGIAGREHVKSNYNYSDNIETYMQAMDDCYNAWKYKE